MKHFNGEIDFDELAKHVLKCDAIIEPIVETFKIKEELKARQELKRVKKVRVKADKYMSPIGEQKFLALCEGASAMSGISASLGRKGIGYYAMRGLPLNAYDSTMQKIVANQELKDIITILELDITKGAEQKTISFDKVLITTDNDVDGTHITAMLIGWFKKFAPNLFNEGKICKLITPLIIIEDSKGNILKYFFDVNSFKAYEKSVSKLPGKVRYLKGLGSWEREQLISLIDKYGVETFMQEYRLDKEGETYIEDWLGSDAEKRKKHLRTYTFDIDKA
jgi:DNA gyrase subunit B